MFDTDHQEVAGSPHRWPDIATIPNRPVRAVIARTLFRRACRALPLQVVESTGPRYGGGDSNDPVMQIARPNMFWRRLGDSGTIGFGEAYMAGDWETADLTGLLLAFAANLSSLIPKVFHSLRNAVHGIQPSRHKNTLEGARRNIYAHYDLSNELFGLFLDESMTYSSAIFDSDSAMPTELLADAQHRKIDRLLDAAAVRQATRLLEIGTGWGELAIRAAARGAAVTSITISNKQASLARARVTAAGVSDRVTILLQDYREVRGQFDAVVSVEMIEAVGAEYWTEYFRAVDRVLSPGGRFGLQAILQDNHTVLTTKDSYSWIRKYIFPGGQIPSLDAINHAIMASTSMSLADRYTFGQHYAETLRRWRAAFDARPERVAELGFDETFRRMWSYYLAYCEAGFRAGYLDVAQLTLTSRS